MRIVIPRIVGRRGAGLANELNGWAKAFIAGQVLHARVMSPAWGLNPRRYRDYFGTSRWDWAVHGLLRRYFPIVELTEADFDGAYGEDFRHTVERFADRNDLHRRRNYVLSVGGMWGGKGILREAYPFLRHKLLSAKGTVENLAELERRLPTKGVRIAVHVRRGDFSPPDVARPGNGPVWNRSLPLSWYVSVCRSLKTQLSVPHRFLLFSDAPIHKLSRLVAQIDPITTAHQSFNVCSDLLTMADADLLITSCSSFSTWAAALSDAPYIWHADNVINNAGTISLWDHGLPLDAACASLPRGVLVDASGSVPPEVVAGLEAAQRHRGWGNDLIRYGTVHLNR